MNITRQVTLATLLTNPNVLSGSAFEYPQQPVQCSLGINVETTGTFVTIYAGSRLIVEEFPPYVASAYPIVPDQMYFNFVALPQERLVVAWRNPTGGTRTAYVMMDIQPIGR